MDVSQAVHMILCVAFHLFQSLHHEERTAKYKISLEYICIQWCTRSGLDKVDLLHGNPYVIMIWIHDLNSGVHIPVF